MLVSARALQGVFGALLAPSSLLTVTFADSPDRAKAFGIFGAIAGGGASVGLLLGGVASAMVNTSQQVGGSVGTALLSTFFATAAASYAASHAGAARLGNAAAIHGYTTAFWWAAGIFGLGLLVALLILPSNGAAPPQPAPAAVAAD